MAKTAVWKKPSIMEAIKTTTKSKKGEKPNTTKPKKGEKPITTKPKKGEKPPKAENKAEEKVGKTQDNQALTEVALAQLENNDPNYVSEYMHNLGDKDQMRLRKKFEADKKGCGDQEAYAMATRGIGAKKKARSLLISWIVGGCNSKSAPYQDHMAKFSTTTVKGHKAVWQPLQFMLNMKYVPRELKARVLAGTIAVRKCPADERFPEFLDVADYETTEAKNEMAKVIQHLGKCTWNDFKVLHDLENQKQELKFDLPLDEAKKKNEKSDDEDHLTALIGNRKKEHTFDDFGFAKAGAIGSGTSAADSKALRQLENCEGMVAGQVDKSKLALALVRAKGACTEVQFLVEEKILRAEGTEKKRTQSKLKDLKAVLKLFHSKKLDDKRIVALVRRSAKVAKACCEGLSLEDC